jgi:hypothetical protein
LPGDAIEILKNNLDWNWITPDQAFFEFFYDSRKPGVGAVCVSTVGPAIYARVGRDLNEEPWPPSGLNFEQFNGFYFHYNLRCSRKCFPTKRWIVDEEMRISGRPRASAQCLSLAPLPNCRA